MANSLYAKAKEAFLSSGIDMLTDNIRVALVKNTYTVDTVNHQYLSDVGEANITGKTGFLTDISITGGIFDAKDELVTDYGNSGFDYLVMYADSGIDSTSRLIAYIDTGEGLPVDPTDENISIAISWSDLVTKIFSL